MSETIYQELDRIEQETEPFVEGCTALQLLQSVYRNPSVPLSVRMRAARDAVAFEAPKLAVQINTSNSFGAALERELQRRIARTERILGRSEATEMEIIPPAKPFNRRV